MEHIYISFCEEANFRSTNQELLSGTVSIDFNKDDNAIIRPSQKTGNFPE